MGSARSSFRETFSLFERFGSTLCFLTKGFEKRVNTERIGLESFFFFTDLCSCSGQTLSLTFSRISFELWLKDVFFCWIKIWLEKIRKISKVRLCIALPNVLQLFIKLVQFGCDFIGFKFNMHWVKQSDDNGWLGLCLQLERFDVGLEVHYFFGAGVERDQFGLFASLERNGRFFASQGFFLGCSDDDSFERASNGIFRNYSHM